MEYHFNSSFLANSYSYDLSCGYDVAIVLSIWRDSMTKRERERHIRWTTREQAFVVVDLALCFFICVWTRPRILTVNELVGSLRQRRQMSVSPCLLPHCSLPFLFPMNTDWKRFKQFYYNLKLCSGAFTSMNLLWLHICDPGE